ncbi:post-GPI attachment to proteins factor 2 [Kryptolebias marmoratus]|uniref:Acyltransferase PGAP2 n=1 Tax=Kryptolebias marmoratus TaxID=37003 RepID=A0A3Q3F3B6_KRYMA|nr:post-GPI attachment to proteins factor 2 [Kryptolebias marmoratus]XP_024859307.1 post-GPI attachment to proteins factor 2 [Kryptolebias marmoratus]XP_024859308.1 post-GPI attachment to proteins factor 2 [Kryptolebias marmoratus]
MLQGPYSSLDRDRDRPLVRLPFTSFAVATVLLPVTGFIACVFISLLYHFEDSTYTHCQVPNYLPSISSAISRVPERYIWRSCIGLHSAPRYLVAVAYFNFYRRRFSARLPELLLSALALICSLTENTGLVLLTYVASTESYKVHKNGFITFIASSLLHMLITCRLWHVIRRHYVNPEEKTSYIWKLRLFLFNVSCCAVAAYFFRRHNKFCETGVYTVFAAFEYLVVFSNMAFHMTAFWDFGNTEVMVATLPEDKRF